MILKKGSLKKLPALLKVTFFNTLHTLPITVACMAVATLTANAIFHLSGNAINVSIIYILVILLQCRYHRFSLQRVLGQLRLYLPIYDPEFYIERLPADIRGNDLYLLFHQQYLHHALQTERTDPGKGPYADAICCAQCPMTCVPLLPRSLVPALPT